MGASAEFARLDEMPDDELELHLERLPRHHLFADIPSALNGWLLPIEWDRELLWALDVPHRRLGLEELRWYLDLPWWRRNGVWFQVTPREFLARPKAHPEHADRVANADLAYPLHVIRRHQRWLILDGIHRLVKAEALGLANIVASTLTPQTSPRSCTRVPIAQPRCARRSRQSAIPILHPSAGRCRKHRCRSEGGSSVASLDLVSVHRRNLYTEAFVQQANVLEVGFAWLETVGFAHNLLLRGHAANRLVADGPLTLESLDGERPVLAVPHPVEAVASRVESRAVNIDLASARVFEHERVG